MYFKIIKKKSLKEICKQDFTVVYIVTIFCLENVVSSKGTP